MRKIFAVAFLVLSAFVATAISEQHHKIASENFDGAKFMERYRLAQDDFHAYYKDGEMYIAIHDNVTIEANPTFEAPDTTKRDRLTTLRAKMKTQDLVLAELNEYIRLRDGI